MTAISTPKAPSAHDSDREDASSSTSPPIRTRYLISSIIILAIALIAAILLSVSKVFSGSVDLANHYLLVDWIYDHMALPSVPSLSLGDMAFYPPGSHVIAAVVGRFTGSPVLGMQIVALVAVAVIWLAIAGILSLLPGIRRWTALGVLAVILLLAAPTGPLQIQLHGWEIISNYFFAQAVGQAVFWVALLWTAWCWVRRSSFAFTAWPLAITAVLCTEVHLVGAFETLVLLWLISGWEFVRRIRNRAKPSVRSVIPLAASGITSVLVAASPGFSGMRALSANDGALTIPGLSSVGWMVALAVFVLVVSTALLLWSRTERLRGTASGGMTTVLSLGAVAIAIPCLSQAAILSGGEGSAYAVKKYAFALVTILAVQVSTAIALVIPLHTDDQHRLTSERDMLLRSGAVAVMALIAIFSLYRQPAPAFTSDLVAMESQMDEYSRTVVETLPDQVNVAYGLPATLRVMDYGFTISALGTGVTPALKMIDYEPTSLGKRLGNIVTAADSPYGSRVDCRRTIPVKNVVVVDGQCVRRPPTPPRNDRKNGS